MRNFHGNLKQMDKRKARLIPALFLCPDPAEDLRQLITDPGSGSRCCSPRGLIPALCASALVFIRPEPLKASPAPRQLHPDPPAAHPGSPAAAAADHLVPHPDPGGGSPGSGSRIRRGGSRCCSPRGLFWPCIGLVSALVISPGSCKKHLHRASGE